jgi:5-hydroxyisourate hydrolase-like protein (transthyretin family)
VCIDSFECGIPRAALSLVLAVNRKENDVDFAREGQTQADGRMDQQQRSFEYSTTLL